MSLQQDYDSLRRDIGRQLFGGTKRDPSLWTAQNEQDVADILRDGYQAMLIPQIDTPAGVYKWQWMRPVTTITVWSTQTGTLTSATQQAGTTVLVAATGTFYESMVGKTITLSSGDFIVTEYVSATSVVVAGNASAATGAWEVEADGDYGLNADIVAIDGNLILSRDEAANRLEVVPRDILDIHAMRSTSETGTPTYFAMKRRAFDGAIGQRWDLAIYPNPDRVYNFTARVTIEPDVIDAVNKWGLGGFPYSRALKLSCLAQMELQHNGQYGAHHQAYLLALQAAIDFDRKAMSAEQVGPNINFGPNDSPRHGWRHSDSVTVSYTP